MDEVLRLKFEQHPALKEQLLSTGDAYLVEDSGANDTFWGNGADGNGRNELGLALMRLRDHFRWNEQAKTRSQAVGGFRLLDLAVRASCTSPPRPTLETMSYSHESKKLPDTPLAIEVSKEEVTAGRLSW
ncbi:hypothetical protein FRB95_013993 [Tulasnella sp. JGI-2019a]|nr:hypothetical protein FRB95_013993 [Tulasnella sp. JGI-2019a]